MTLGSPSSGPAKWSSLLGAPFVVVSPLGTGSGYPINDYAQFGPDTPGTTTGGVQEAFNAVSTPANPFFGYSVWIKGSGPIPFTTQITIPSNITVLMGSPGGENYGPGHVPPNTYLSFTGPSTVTDAVLISEETSCQLYGFAVISGVVGLRSVFRITGSRGVNLTGCYTESTVPGTIGLLYDGLVGENDEDNMDVDHFSAADPAIQFGLAGEVQHPNDSIHINFRGEGIWTQSVPNFVVQANGAVIKALTGGNQQFYNFYSRGNTSINAGAVQVLCDGGNVYLFGGEQFSHVPTAGLWTATSGTILFRDGSITSGNIIVNGGTVQLANVRIDTSPGVVITISAGTFYADPETRLTQLSLTISGGSAWLPEDSPFSTGPAAFNLAAFTRAAGNVAPRPVSGTLYPTNPPASGTAVQNSFGNRVTVYIPVVTLSAVTVALQNPLGTNVVTPVNAITMAAGSIIAVDVPPNWYLVVTYVTGDLGPFVAILRGMA